MYIAVIRTDVAAIQTAVQTTVDSAEQIAEYTADAPANWITVYPALKAAF